VATSRVEVQIKDQKRCGTFRQFCRSQKAQFSSQNFEMKQEMLKEPVHFKFVLGPLKKMMIILA
jgi:hypothetical protein